MTRCDAGKGPGSTGGKGAHTASRQWPAWKGGFVWAVPKSLTCTPHGPGGTQARPESALPVLLGLALLLVPVLAVLLVVLLALLGWPCGWLADSAVDAGLDA